MGEFKHKHSLGQNFLIKDEVVDGIVEGAMVTKEDLVIEIGPGLGSLTKELLERAGKVIAIELDKRMLEIFIIVTFYPFYHQKGPSRHQSPY